MQPWNGRGTLAQAVARLSQDETDTDVSHELELVAGKLIKGVRL